MDDSNDRYARLGCLCGAIDAHTHVVPDRLPSYTGRRSGVPWPSLEAGVHACEKNVMVDGAVYRKISSSCWSAQERLDDMGKMGIAHQVLSPMPELLSYWLDAADAQPLIRFINEWLAETVARHPRHFAGLAAVPLQDVEMAIEEMRFACGELGLAGIEIGSNVNGRPIGSPEFLPFFQAAAEMDVPIFAHALRPAGMDRLVGPPLLEQVLAFPGEIGLAAASLVTAETLVKCPKLRIAFSHGGGSLPMLAWRLQHAWSQMAPIKSSMSMAPLAAARSFYYDDLVYSQVGIETLIRSYGIDRVMIGTDYPFPILEKSPIERLKELGLESSQMQALVRENAQRWLGNRSMSAWQ
ncbi:amidohydrolase family protein [Variovorax paradoxus]|uniref:amidohydrolase family protein n=1 Tax=Variovorax paradoxus TaxID=34073 RepID=UPI003ECC4AB8